MAKNETKLAIWSHYLQSLLMVNRSLKKDFVKPSTTYTLVGRFFSFCRHQIRETAMTPLPLLLLLYLVRLISGYVICPYCDPNYMAYPNLEESCRGYDVPMGNPSPGNRK